MSELLAKIIDAQHEERSSLTPYGTPDQRTSFTPKRIALSLGTRRTRDSILSFPQPQNRWGVDRPDPLRARARHQLSIGDWR